MQSSVSSFDIVLVLGFKGTPAKTTMSQLRPQIPEGTLAFECVL